MATVKPYFTSDDLVESVQRRISFPLSQNTFTYNDLLAFANEEMQISAVPTVKEAHEEYFVFKKIVPLVNGISRYPIPDRSIGMALSDLCYSDVSGNYFDMVRVAASDKAFFQASGGANGSVAKYYLEGNEVVLTPQIVSGATGNLNFFIFLRPNLLVRNERAAKIVNYVKYITISTNSAIIDGDTIVITTGNQTPFPNQMIFTAVTGSPVTPYEFQIGVDENTTASNLNTVIQNLGMEGISTTVALNVISFFYEDISTTFEYLNTTAFVIDLNYLYILFDNLASTYTDPDTNQIEPLYTTNSLVDFLQTALGHRTFTYDIKLRAIPFTNVGKFLLTDLQTFLNNSSGGLMSMLPMKIGDYICLQNECIIPQIPSDLHTALAERTASRILMAIGDKDGLAISQQKIAEMDKSQSTLIDNRVEGANTKVFNKNSLLRLGKRSAFR